MKVFVAGHRGLVGSALVRRLRNQPGTELLLRTRTHLDLTDQRAVREFFAAERPEKVIVSLGGQTPLKLASEIPAELIAGTSPDSIDAAEDREPAAAALKMGRFVTPVRRFVTVNAPLSCALTLIQCHEVSSMFAI